MCFINKEANEMVNVIKIMFRKYYNDNEDIDLYSFLILYSILWIFPVWFKMIEINMF